MNEHLLSLTVWIPIVGALLVTLAPKSATKGISTVASFLAMIASIVQGLPSPNNTRDDRITTKTKKQLRMAIILHPF